MRAVAVALLLEEQRGEIVGAWRDDVARELGGEPSLAFAVGPLLREMALALRDETPSALRAAAGRPPPAAEAGARSAVLVRSGAGPARVAREFKLLHRGIWQTLKRAGAVVSADERRAGDEWLDEALAVALDRQDRLRTRAEVLEAPSAFLPPPPGAAAVPARTAGGAPAGAPLRATPPPLPWRGAEPHRRAPAAPPPAAARPPPLPVAARRPQTAPVVVPGLAGLE